MTLALVPAAQTFTAPPQVPLPAVTWVWEASRLVAVCAWPESLTRRTEQVREAGVQYPPMSATLHRARIMDIINLPAATVSEALPALASFIMDNYARCPSQMQLLSPARPALHVGFRAAVSERIRDHLELGALRSLACFDIDRPETVDTLPVYAEDSHAIIEPAVALAFLIQGRDDPAVFSKWAFDEECPCRDAARAELSEIMSLPDQFDLSVLSPMPRCIARLSAFLDQPQHRAWLEPSVRSGRSGRRGVTNHSRWEDTLIKIEDATR